MSHAVESMAYRFADRTDVPWHGLGVPIDRNEQISRVEFMSRAGANWPVIKRRLYHYGVALHEDHRKEYPNRYALVRGDKWTPLSIVSKQYNPIQNVEVFEFFEEYCTKGDMDLETGGVLDEGCTIWALASIRKGFTLANGDHVIGHLLFYNTHDGKGGGIKFTPIRVVCANTLAMALSGSGSSFKINHRVKFDAETAKTTLGISHHQLEKFREQSEFLASKKMYTGGFNKFLEHLFPPKITVDEKTKEQIIERPRHYERGMRALIEQPQLGEPNTWWQGFNAITYMLDHQERSNKANQLSSNWFGNGANIKQQALTTALEFAKTA